MRIEWDFISLGSQMDFTGMSLDLMGFQRDLMRFHGISWDLMESGFFWDLMKSNKEILLYIL